MKLQNASHTTEGNCGPKLTIASSACVKPSGSGGYRGDRTAQPGASTPTSRAPSPAARARRWVVGTAAGASGAGEVHGAAPLSAFRRGRDARFHFTALKHISCCSLC